ncbi:MAG: S-methyl-5-thioribose-1-phosphate isomerase [Candidatus Aminicenantales bacterium]
MLPTIEWDEGQVVMIDQRKLPLQEVYVRCGQYRQVAEAIEKMVIRGAPAIGVAAAFGLALGILEVEEKTDFDLDKHFSLVSERLRATRPTARNLFWALERMERVFRRNRKQGLESLKKRLVEEALAIEKEDIATNRKIGWWGRRLIKEGQAILTHCNAGALATAGYGTALGVIRAAVEEGKKIEVYVDETRPFLQGARLTCWELAKENIPVTLITDNMAGYLMQQGKISMLITGADRIAANGDTVNKIGTYSAAVLAKEHELPFYVAAPLATVDFRLKQGSQIPIEERDPSEVKEINGQLITLPEIKALNPAFDLTPAQYITAIITEKGIAWPPLVKSLAELKHK